MRLPLKGTGNSAVTINDACEELQTAFREAAEPAVRTRTVDVMTADGSSSHLESFDPAQGRELFQHLSNMLKNWISDGVQESSTDDLRRIFFHACKNVESYKVCCYFGIQFHAFPYYKHSARVGEILREMALMEQNAARLFGEVTLAGDKALEKELGNKGLANLGFEELFTKIYEDENLLGDLETIGAKIEKEFADFQNVKEKRDTLIAELNTLTTEVFHTTSTLIDYNRLISGEEGIITYVDVDRVNARNKTKTDSEFEVEKILASDAKKIALALSSISQGLRAALSPDFSKPRV